MDTEKKETKPKKETTGKKETKKATASKKPKRKLNIKLLVFAALLLVIGIGVAAFLIQEHFSLISDTHLTDEGFKHAKRFDKCIRVQGIDVSEYQSKVNWKKVKSSEADFAFVRVGYRKSDDGELYTDETFRANLKNAHKAGVLVGAYFFSQAVNKDEAEAEAKYLVKLVKNYDIDLPLVIDYEALPDGRIQKAIDDGDLYASSQFHDIVEAFCRKVESYGYESAVYANYDMLTNNMDSKLLQDDNTIWAAQYGEKCDLKTSYSFWQCSDSAAIGGIEGNVDRDFWYIEPGKLYRTRAESKKDPTSIGIAKIVFDDDTCEIKHHRAVPKLSVYVDGQELKKGKDYEVYFLKNTQPGTGYAIVRGIKKYKDWTTVAFNIEG